MATSIQRMARWARQLDLQQVPGPVVERLRLQQLSVAGAVHGAAALPAARALRQAAGRGRTALLVGGGRSSRRDAVVLHVALASMLEHGDDVLFSSTGAAALPVAWAHARGHSVEDLLVAVLAGQEIAGRLGAAMLLGPDQDLARPLHAAVGAAVVAGLLGGLDADALAHAIALSTLASARATPAELRAGLGGVGVARGAAAGLAAVAEAAAGLHGPLDTLDAHGGVLETRTPVPLRAAFSGLGKAWLCQSLSVRLHPGARALQAPLQAVHEILRRHIKAADKRLRPDQVERIEVELSAPAWWETQRMWSARSPAPAGLVHDLRRMIGLLVTHHDLSPGMFTTAALARRQEELAAVAARVEVRHSWERSLDLASHLVDVLGPLFAGVDRRSLRRAERILRAHTGADALSPPQGARGLWGVLAARPDRLLAALRYQSGDLGDARLDAFQLRLGTDVRLHTTRGGTWPEHRDLIEGSPGWPWQDTVQAMCAKWGGEGHAAKARELAAVDVAAEAEGWVSALIGPDLSSGPARML